MILNYHTSILTKKSLARVLPSHALNLLRHDTSIIIKEAEKGSCVVGWNRQDYLSNAEKQLQDKETHEELLSDPVSPLISILKYCLSQVKNKGDIPIRIFVGIFVCKKTETRKILSITLDPHTTA